MFLFLWLVGYSILQARRNGLFEEKLAEKNRPKHVASSVLPCLAARFSFCIATNFVSKLCHSPHKWRHSIWTTLFKQTYFLSHFKNKTLLEILEKGSNLSLPHDLCVLSFLQQPLCHNVRAFFCIYDNCTLHIPLLVWWCIWNWQQTLHCCRFWRHKSRSIYDILTKQTILFISSQA